MSKFIKMMNHPIINKLCHKYRWLGKLLCKLNINHSLVVTAIHTEPLDIIAKCKYCGKEFRGENR